MVFHDAVLDRMTNASGTVADHTVAELDALSLNGGNGAGIPTLAEILQIVGARVPLLIELKDQTGALGPGPLTLEPGVARLLQAYAGPVAVMSFNPEMIGSLAERAPEVPRGLTTSAFGHIAWPHLPRDRARHLADIADADPVGAAFISHDRRDLAAPAVVAQRRANRAVLCWTIRGAAEEAAARRYADQITFEGYRPEGARKT